MGLFSGLANLPGVKQLLQFDANNIYQASNAASHLLGNNFLGHLADYGTREGQLNKQNSARQLRKGVQFLGKYYLGQGIGAMFGGGAGVGSEAGSEAGGTAAGTGGSVDQALATWGTEGGGNYAGSGEWGDALGTGASAGGTMADWGTDRSATYPGSDKWSAESGGAAPTDTKTTGEKSLMKDIGRSVAVGAGTNLLTQAMSPKPKEPEATKPTPMPDPAAQEQAARRKRIEQLARRGRAASILTDPGY